MIKNGQPDEIGNIIKDEQKSNPSVESEGGFFSDAIDAVTGVFQDSPAEVAADAATAVKEAKDNLDLAGKFGVMDGGDNIFEAQRKLEDAQEALRVANDASNMSIETATQAVENAKINLELATEFAESDTANAVFEAQGQLEDAQEALRVANDAAGISNVPADPVADATQAVADAQGQLEDAQEALRVANDAAQATVDAAPVVADAAQATVDAAPVVADAAQALGPIQVSDVAAQVADKIPGPVVEAVAQTGQDIINISPATGEIFVDPLSSVAASSIDAAGGAAGFANALGDISFAEKVFNSVASVVPPQVIDGALSMTSTAGGGLSTLAASAIALGMVATLLQVRKGVPEAKSKEVEITEVEAKQQIADEAKPVENKPAVVTSIFAKFKSMVAAVPAKFKANTVEKADFLERYSAKGRASYFSRKEPVLESGETGPSQRTVMKMVKEGQPVLSLLDSSKRSYEICMTAVLLNNQNLSAVPREIATEDFMRDVTERKPDAFVVKEDFLSDTMKATNAESDVAVEDQVSVLAKIMKPVTEAAQEAKAAQSLNSGPDLA